MHADTILIDLMTFAADAPIAPVGPFGDGLCHEL
ncbi:hypothetical protein FHR90_001757 [Endobacter medicaginis]|jgi:hypothetical protein|uniref:Uncharacterized protein n=1 Tax=Endobacter medicaginis TaxID=1181271 RepID=A0A839UZ73_9PROT|nr:hypothetical protein [Endobacter medicaginis]